MGLFVANLVAQENDVVTVDPLLFNLVAVIPKVSLTLKTPNKIAADDILIFYFYLSKKIRLDFSCESSA